MSAVALENIWTFWTSNMRGDPDVKFLNQFNSIQVFWDQFKAQPVTKLPDKTYLHVFKGDIKPLWEDPSNYCGGHFKLTAKSQAASENMWVTVLLNMLGEQFPSSELVNGASVMSNQVGNNLVKVWLASTDKTKVQAVREFLHTILESSDFMPNVTFVPHKLVVKGAGKKVSSRITDAPPRHLAPRGSIDSDNTSVGCPSDAGDFAPEVRLEGPAHGFRRRMNKELELTVPFAGGLSVPYPSPAPRSPASTMSFGVSSVPSSHCSEYSPSMPPSPRPVSPTASYTGSEWEADCGGKLMPPSPGYFFPRPQVRRWSVASQDYSYTHNPYSLANSVIYSNA